MESYNNFTDLKGELGAEQCYQDTSREGFGKPSHHREMVESKNGALPTIQQGFDRTYPLSPPSNVPSQEIENELRFLPPPLFISSPKKIAKKI
jgi:hypothetical protein